MSAWQPIEEFERFTQALEGFPVLLYSKEWVGEYEPDGVVQGFYETGNRWVGAFWNNYQDTWDAKTCEPTHFALIEAPDNA